MKVDTPPANKNASSFTERMGIEIWSTKEVWEKTKEDFPYFFPNGSRRRLSKRLELEEKSSFDSSLH